MQDGTAPFRADLAEGPPGGAALWLRTADGLRIRMAYWAASGASLRGTVVLLPGRTEYIEKYGRVAADLVHGGWSVLVVDWRGQGLSDRLLPDPMMGHVGRFGDYQRDLDACLDWLERDGPSHGLIGPRVMLAHSMGGLIGLRALHRGLGFRAAVFSAPMWGIRMPLWRRPTAAVLSRLSLALPQDRGYAPTTSGRNYLLVADFEGNHLTSDRDTWAYLHAQALANPLYGLGGPSLGWVRDALREARGLMALPAPAVPVVSALGSEEHIVLPGPIHQYMATWPGGRLDVYAGARHEIPMEGPEHRGLFLNRALTLFNEATEAAKAG